MFRGILRNVVRSNLGYGTEQYSKLQVTKFKDSFHMSKSSSALYLATPANRVVTLRMYATEGSTDPPSGDSVLDLLSQLTSAESLPDLGNFDMDEGQFDDLEPLGSDELPTHRIRGILIPSEETNSAMIDGQRYDQLPIAHIQASYQNTMVVVTNHAGRFIANASGGSVGFKNAKKKTTIAAQAAGLAAGQHAAKTGIVHVKVAIKGIGKGRLAACKGLEEAGLKLVSLTDVSRVDFGTNMPKKRRRL